MTTINNINKIVILFSKEIKKPYFLIILLIIFVICLYITFYLYKVINQMYEEVKLKLFSIESTTEYHKISKKEREETKNYKIAKRVSNFIEQLTTNILNKF